MYSQENIRQLEHEWATQARWKGILRTYKAEDVVRLRGSVHIEHTLATRSARKLWRLFETEPSVRALGALTGNQAVQMVQAGLKAIYISGWQVASDNNDALQTYPDLSLYPVQSVPHLITRINNALLRADQIQHMENRDNKDWLVPIVADAEAGFGGPLNTFELVKAMIQAGTAAIHLEDQLSAFKKCGHMGGKVLVPVNVFVQKLMMARLAADILGVPTILIARTDAESATLIHSDSHPVDQPFLNGKRSYEGYFYIKNGLEYAIQRGLAFAPYADMIWWETPRPDLGEAREFAEGIHEKFPGKWLGYNCSPSFNWRHSLDEKTIATFHEKLAELGYNFQFVTLAGFHALSASIFQLAHEYNLEGMAAYSRLQQHEFELEHEYGYRATKHQSFVGAGYFDEILMAASEGQSATASLKGSTEEAQFDGKNKA